MPTSRQRIAITGAGGYVPEWPGRPVAALLRVLPLPIAARLS